MLFGKFIFLVATLTAPFMTWNFVCPSRGKGEWDIQITQHEVVWQPPENVGEKILSLLISEISIIICESFKNTAVGNYYYGELPPRLYMPKITTTTDSRSEMLT